MKKKIAYGAGLVALIVHVVLLKPYNCAHPFNSANGWYGTNLSHLSWGPSADIACYSDGSARVLVNMGIVPSLMMVVIVIIAVVTFALGEILKDGTK